MNNNLVYSDNPSRKSAFITNDGKFVNLQENKVQILGYSGKEVTHSAFIIYLHKQGIKVKDLNLIRVNDGAYVYVAEEAYISLPEQEPNKAQYNAILKWLDFLSLHSKKNYLCIGINSRADRFEFLNVTHPNGMLPEEIIKEIKRLYETTKER